MKWIDDKGRLFGKVHFFDGLIALLVVIGILAMALRFAPKEEQAEKAKTFSAVYTIEMRDMGDLFLDAFAVGDTLYEWDAPIGVVTAVEIRPATMPYVGAAGTLLMPEYKHRHHITLTVETDQMSKSEKYFIGKQEFLNGTGHTISNGFAQCYGVVREINIK